MWLTLAWRPEVAELGGASPEAALFAPVALAAAPAGHPHRAPLPVLPPPPRAGGGWAPREAFAASAAAPIYDVLFDARLDELQARPPLVRATAGGCVRC